MNNGKTQLHRRPESTMKEEEGKILPPIRLEQNVNLINVSDELRMEIWTTVAKLSEHSLSSHVPLLSHSPLFSLYLSSQSIYFLLYKEGGYPLSSFIKKQFAHHTVQITVRWYNKDIQLLVLLFLTSPPIL